MRTACSMLLCKYFTYHYISDLIIIHIHPFLQRKRAKLAGTRRMFLLNRQLLLVLVLSDFLLSSADCIMRLVLYTNLASVLSLTVETVTRTAEQGEGELEGSTDEEDPNTVGGFSVLGTSELHTSKQVSIWVFWCRYFWLFSVDNLRKFLPWGIQVSILKESQQWWSQPTHPAVQAHLSS